MNQNKAAFNNEKLSKVIALSSNYKKHREIIASAKAVIDFSDEKHMKRTLKLSIQKNRYTHNVRNLKLSELKKQNNDIIRRIIGVGSAVKRQISPSLSPKKDNRTLEHNDHNSSRKSFTSVSSQKSCSSNFRRRTMRQKEIQLENKKIASRIMHPKMAKDINYDKMCKFYQKQQSYSRIRSRFSERSQSIMQSLALGDLKLQKKHVQFLPQLSFKRLDHLQHKPKTLRQKRHLQTTTPIMILPVT